MGDLTLNISRHEVACKCGCGFDTLDLETAKIIQECCDHIAQSMGLQKVVLLINSGCRCFAWNDHVNGSDRSLHLWGRALDFYIKDVDPALVYEHLSRKYAGKYGIGKYKTFTHLDTRSGAQRRWKA